MLLTSRLLGDGLGWPTAGTGVLIVGHVGNVAAVTEQTWHRKKECNSLVPRPNSHPNLFSNSLTSQIPSVLQCAPIASGTGLHVEWTACKTIPTAMLQETVLRSGGPGMRLN